MAGPVIHRVLSALRRATNPDFTFAANEAAADDLLAALREIAREEALAIVRAENAARADREGAVS